MSTKAAELYALLFVGPSAVLPPGLARKGDIYRVWMNFRRENGGHISKDDFKSLMPKLAKQVEDHYRCLEDSGNLVTFNTIKTNVTRIIRAGDYLNNSGGRINDEKFIQEHTAFFSEVVYLKKSTQKEPVTSAEVFF